MVSPPLRVTALKRMQLAKLSFETCKLPLQAPATDWVVSDAADIAVLKVTDRVAGNATLTAPAAGLVDTTVGATAFTVRLPVSETVPKVPVMVLLPPLTAVAKPAASIVAAVVDEPHVVVAVTSIVIPLSRVTIAVYCTVCPMFSVVLSGVTESETATGVVTVRLALPLIVPTVALIVLLPALNVVARPSEPEALEITATAVSDELQVAVVVTSWVLPSLRVPSAVNACVVPLGRELVAGVMAMLVRTALVTVSVVLPDTVPNVALTVVLPTATAVAVPSLPAAFETVAALLFEEAQVTCVVRSVTTPLL